MKKVFLLMAFLLMITIGCGGDHDHSPQQTFGVVALSNVGSIGILDGKTQTVTAPFLTGEFGSIGGGLFDVVISPDGKTTLLSNFGDSTVFFIDTSHPAEPVVSGSVEIGFFAEDIALTPDGRYAVVTDGGFSSKIAVLDVEKRILVEAFETEADTTDPENPIPRYHNAVAVAADGVTVLTADYFQGQVHALLLSEDGHLTFVGSTDVSNKIWDEGTSEFESTIFPVNLAISPDGQTVIVASVPRSDEDTMAFPVLTITDPGQVTVSDMVIPDLNVRGSQSIVFNRAGTKAYLHCTQPLPDPYPADPEYLGPKNVILVLNVSASGEVSDANTPVEVDFFGRSQLFGVDTLAMDNPGKNLYVSNPTLAGASNHLQIVDVETNALVETLSFDPVGISEGDPPVETLTDVIPAGVIFWQH